MTAITADNSGYAQDANDVRCLVSPQPESGGVSCDLLQALLRIKAAQHFRKGATLMQCGSPGSGVYLVETGEVQVFLEGGKGKSSSWKWQAPPLFSD